MKKWLQVVATLALAICAMVLVNVQDVKADRITSTDGQWEYEADYFNSTCTVTDYLGDAVDLVIPSKIDGLKVTEIYTYARGFSSLPDNIESISIPNTVTSIDAQSFTDLENLRTVNLPSKLQTIGNYAFYGCTSLEEITIPKSVSSIGVFAFARCTSLKEVNMPKVQVISEQSFYNCTSLEKIKLPSGLKEIGNKAFCNTSLKTVNLPSTLEYIGYDAFVGTKISELVIPEFAKGIYGSVSIGNLTNIDIYVLNPDTGLSSVSQTCTIHGFKNSKAYESAKSMGVRFVEIKGGISSAKGKKSGAKSVLSWKKAKGAKSYTIFRYNSSKGVWQKIATTKKTKYTDKSKSASNKYRVTYTFKQGDKTLTGGIDIQI